MTSLKLPVGHRLKAKKKVLRAARLGEKVAQSVLRLNSELKNYKPQVRNLATTRKTGKIMEKAQKTNQLSRMDTLLISANHACV